MTPGIRESLDGFLFCVSTSHSVFLADIIIEIIHTLSVLVIIRSIHLHDSVQALASAECTRQAIGSSSSRRMAFCCVDRHSVRLHQRIPEICHILVPDAISHPEGLNRIQAPPSGS